MWLVLVCVIVVSASVASGGILYPKDSETRQSMSLDGVWAFAVGYNETWSKGFKPLVNSTLLMPVPASYNDITTSPELRDLVGVVAYQREFFVPAKWRTERVWLRFSSVCYSARVLLNGAPLMAHQIGHLPFQAEVTAAARFGAQNVLVVVVNNTLTSTTVPQGSVKTLKSGRLKQTFTFDFFNYAGIDRPVTLYTTPRSYVDDLAIRTEISASKGIVYYNVTVVNETEIACKVTLFDKLNKIVATGSQLVGKLVIEKAELWWPYLSHPNPGYLYMFQVQLLAKDGSLVDSYHQRVGIRTVAWTNTSLLLNGKPIYLKGFGRHEDADVRGKGLDLPIVVRDHNLIRWVGANAYRTSHYPYAEEIMDVAEELGIMIIDECPSTDTDVFSKELLANHKRALSELIQRDKNRANVIMWSVSNEPRASKKAAGPYYQELVKHVKALDRTRPVTLANAQNHATDQVSQYLDVLSFNRYNGWYSEPGSLDVVAASVVEEGAGWHKKFNKPVIMQEYGADAQEGLHINPDFIWTEEYQMGLMSQHFKAFDELRKAGFFVGEFVWNFADFKTDQSYTRVGGNKKGIFTRNRQPKAAAFHLRRRYWYLANEIYNVTLPNDLYNYVSTRKGHHDEL